MKLCDKILFQLIDGIRKQRGYEIIIPNFYVGRWEMDLFRLLPNGYLWEYEIKTSRADFLNDFKKSYDNWYTGEVVNKHHMIRTRQYPANRFVFVVPDGMVSVDEVPDYAGLIYYQGDGFALNHVKEPMLLHKTKHYQNKWQELAKSLSFREINLRLKLSRLKEENVILRKN